MITKLDSARLNRTVKGLQLFATEFTGIPECFIKDGLPFNGTYKNAVLSKQAGSGGTHFSKNQVPSIFDFGWKKNSMGKLAIDCAPPINQQLLKDFTTTCKHAKSLLPSVNCTKCACAKKEIPFIEQCSCRRKCSLLQGQLH